MIWWRDLLRFSRDQSQIIGSLSRPLLWLVVLGFGLGSVVTSVGGLTYPEFLLPGIIGLNLLFASFLSAISIIWDREFGFLKEMLVAPISRTTIAVGKALSGSSIAVLQGGLVLIFAPLVGVRLTMAHVLSTVALMCLIAFACTSLGLLVASRTTSFEGFGVISNLIIMPMFFLSGAMFPVERLPSWLAVLVRLNPMTYGVDALRATLIGTHAFPVWWDLGFVAGFAALALWGAVWYFNRTS